MFELCILSHVVAVAVTEEVSLTAVPAKTENPLLDSPIKSPSVGNISAAKMLNKKITEIAFAISSSSALMTGAVAAIAEPPQMEDPTPTKVAVLLSRLNFFCNNHAQNREVVIVDKIIGKEVVPTIKTCDKLRPNPSKTTANCRIYFDVNLIPAPVLALSL